MTVTRQRTLRLLRNVLAAVLVFTAPLLAENVVLVNGTVIDGTGKARVVANVRIRDGKVVDIGLFKPAAGESTIDVKGMIVAPGFVDFESLSPADVEKDSSAAALITQGVTTTVLGSDGSGPYSVEDFMLPFDEKPPAVNIAMLVGHTRVRRQIMGDDYKRPATGEEIGRMAELISDAMKQGAFGIGSDLQHEPASFSSPEEVTALAKVAVRLGGTLVMSLRDEQNKLADSVKEAIALARDVKISVQVRTTNKTAITEFDKARVQRLDIAADSYSFAQLTRDKGVMLERAIQRLSANPASRIGLRERGVLKKGAPADVVVFNPMALSAGMKYVFVNGVAVVKDTQTSDARPGQALR